jgi:hypothetical protein
VSSAFRKALTFSGETWSPTPEPERPRGADAGRSTEATRRRRERKRGRWVDAGGSTPTIRAPPTPKPAESAFAEHLLAEAESLLPWGMRASEPAFLADTTHCLRMPPERAMALVDELERQGRLERNVASNEAAQ